MSLNTPEKRHTYWKDPAGSGLPKGIYKTCEPEFYLDLVNVTRLVVETIQRYAQPEWSILELGCGTGRNLAGLYKAGFHNLAGIEINPHAVQLGMIAFPELKDINIAIAPIEDVFADLPRFDVIYTSGVWMHFPHDMEWMISKLRDKARYVIITNEGERLETFHAWLHDYKKIIEEDGIWEQVETHSDEAYPPLHKETIKRVFTRVKAEPPPMSKRQWKKEKG